MVTSADLSAEFHRDRSPRAGRSGQRALPRRPLVRLDAEQTYDTLVHAAGRLDPTPFGPADAVQTRADGLVTPAESARGCAG